MKLKVFTWICNDVKDNEKWFIGFAISFGSRKWYSQKLIYEMLGNHSLGSSVYMYTLSTN